jgi:hypothetical protein
LERLEAARERQAKIQLHHRQLTLDPKAASKNGTLQQLQQMLSDELTITANDKALLEQDRKATFDDEHDDDKITQEQKEKSAWLFDYFHEKINNMDSDSELDMCRLSDVSDEESSSSSSASHPIDDGNSVASTSTPPDEDMPDKDRNSSPTVPSSTPSSPTAPHTYQKGYPQLDYPTTVAQPKTAPDNCKRAPKPASWGSDDDSTGSVQPSSTSRKESEWISTPKKQTNPSSPLQQASLGKNKAPLLSQPSPPKPRLSQSQSRSVKDRKSTRLNSSH